MALSLVLFCFGWPIAKRLGFPLLFLFFMVPVGDFLIPQLQTFTGDFSVRLLRLSGVPVYRDGNLIQIPSGAFLVAEACAGLRFLIANVVIASLFSYLAYAKWWKHCLFMVIAIVIPILANGFRAFGIIYLAYLTDNRIAAGADHIIYGWGFFSLVMLVLLAIGSTFADRSRGSQWLHGSARGQPYGHTQARPKPWRHVFAAAAALIILSAPGYVWALMGTPVVAPDHRPAPISVSEAWLRLPLANPDWQPQFPGADWTLRDTYRQGEDEVDVFVAFYDYQRRGAEVVYYANSIADEKTWSPNDAAIATVHQRASLVAARADDLASSINHRIVIWWYWVDGQLTESALRAKILQLAARLFGGSQAAAVVAVSVEYDGDRDKAIATADRFLRESAPMDAYLEGLSRR